MYMKFARQIRVVCVLAAVLCTSAVLAADRVAADAYLSGVPKLLTDGDFKSAEDLCKRAIDADPNCPAAHFHLASCYEKTNRFKEAYKEYTLAAAKATADKDNVMAGKASSAAKKLGGGMGDLDALDKTLSTKLEKIANEALDAGQLETAKQAFNALLSLQPENLKAKEALAKVTKALEDKGDPVKTKVAQAMLSEMWYKFGVGNKDEATVLAKRLSTQYPETEMGKEAQGLMERDFAAPTADEIVAVAKEAKAKAKKPIKAVSISTPPATGSTKPPPSTVMTSPAVKQGLDVEALEKAADAETAAMAKTALVPTFTAAHDKGKDHYTKATPGSEGNQENVAKALEQFIRCASLYQRIEKENLSTEDLAARAKNASMLHYACLKMTILSH